MSEQLGAPIYKHVKAEPPKERMRLADVSTPHGKHAVLELCEVNGIENPHEVTEVGVRVDGSLYFRRGVGRSE